MKEGGKVSFKLVKARTLVIPVLLLYQVHLVQQQFTLACGQSITSDSYDSWFPDNVPFCGNEVNSRSNWFKFTGTGENTVISTCSSQNTTSNTIISIFEGTCTNLNCITSNDDFCGVRSNVSFTPLNGVEYYILVHGDNEFGPGDFTITRACDNDICTGAIDIPCGTSIEEVRSMHFQVVD